MKNESKTPFFILLVTLLGALISGCAADISRNEDGSLTIETGMTAESWQSEIQTDTLTFRLDLGASDGHLTATISNALIDGQAMDADRVALWNERIANRLENFGQRRPNSSLQSVTVTSEAIEIVWHIETARSQGN